MRHMPPLNKKAARIDNYVVSRKDDDVVALQSPPGRRSARMSRWPAR